MVDERDRSVADIESSFEEHNTNQVEASSMSSENKISVSKMQKLQEKINAIAADPNITIIKKEEAEDKI